MTHPSSPETRQRKRLLFVYNADTGVFNAALDIAHKIFSPSTYSCQLCALTHSYFEVRAAWQTFVPQLEADCEFMHRDEFRRVYPEIEVALPAIFIRVQERVDVWMSNIEIANCADLPQLMQMISRKLDTA